MVKFLKEVGVQKQALFVEYVPLLLLEPPNSVCLGELTSTFSPLQDTGHAAVEFSLGTSEGLLTGPPFPTHAIDRRPPRNRDWKDQGRVQEHT